MEYINKICKLGQMAECCRYLGAGITGICCLKKTSLKAQLDRRVALKLMHAQADNCEGQDPDVDLTTLPLPNPII
jgi:hypothetical protein